MLELYRQAIKNEYRGVVLPKGMTPACLDELAKILNRHASGSEDWLDAEAAVQVFKVVKSHLPERDDSRAVQLELNRLFPAKLNDLFRAGRCKSNPYRNNT